MNNQKCKVGWWFTEEFFGRNVYETGLEIIRKHHNLIDEILPCWYSVDEKGSVIQMVTDEHVTEVKELCGKLNIKMIPLIAPTSAESLKRVLNDKKIYLEHIKQVVDLVEKKDFIGIDVDYESLPPDFRERYTEFFIALGTEMKARKKILSLPLQPKTSDMDPTVPGAAAQDYRILAQYVDNLRVMCYDQHHPVYTPPGPVSGTSWAENVMRYASSVIPRDKLYMGLPVYGIDWDLSSNSDNNYVSYADAEQTAASHGIKVLQNEELSPHFQYDLSEGTREVWYTNAEGFARGLETAIRYKAAGISVWVLSGEDPRVWDIIREGTK